MYSPTDPLRAVQEGRLPNIYVSEKQRPKVEKRRVRVVVSK